MFGLEKKPQGKFQFDLEVDLLTNPDKAKELLKLVEEKTAKLKTLLRQGAETGDFDEYGVLLHAFMAMLRVFNRITKKKP